MFGEYCCGCTPPCRPPHVCSDCLSTDQRHGGRREPLFLQGMTIVLQRKKKAIIILEFVLCSSPLGSNSSVPRTFSLGLARCSGFVPRLLSPHDQGQARSSCRRRYWHRHSQPARVARTGNDHGSRVGGIGEQEVMFSVYVLPDCMKRVVRLRTSILVPLETCHVMFLLVCHIPLYGLPIDCLHRDIESATICSCGRKQKYILRPRDCLL